LWQVTSDSTTIYLLGSIHFLTAESYPLNPSIEKVFEECSTVFFEMNLDEATSPEAQTMILMKSMFQNDKTLQTSLSAETYALADSAAQKVGLIIQQFNGFKPWFFALTLVALKIQKLGFNPEYGVDAYFFNRAKKREMKIFGLETAAYQIDLLDALIQEDQEAMLLQTIGELDMLDHELNELVDAWKNGDSEKLEKVILSSFEAYPKVYDTMVVQRNKNWLPVVESYLKKNKKTIVIVGTAHLVGPDGLVAGLRNLGYSVVQMEE